jgi:hypothetical protein
MSSLTRSARRTWALSSVVWCTAIASGAPRASPRMRAASAAARAPRPSARSAPRRGRPVLELERAEVALDPGAHELLAARRGLLRSTPAGRATVTSGRSSTATACARRTGPLPSRAGVAPTAPATAYGPGASPPPRRRHPPRRCRGREVPRPTGGPTAGCRPWPRGRPRRTPPRPMRRRARRPRPPSPPTTAFPLLQPAAHAPTRLDVRRTSGPRPRRGRRRRRGRRQRRRRRL